MLFSFVVATLLMCCYARPDGAPSAACNTMVPSHSGTEVTPGGNELYSIDVLDLRDGSYEGTCKP